MLSPKAFSCCHCSSHWLHTRNCACRGLADTWEAWLLHAANLVQLASCCSCATIGELALGYSKAGSVRVTCFLVASLVAMAFSTTAVSVLRQRALKQGYPTSG